MRPTLKQQRDYLAQFAFGEKGTELEQFISRAYRDMNRTIRGIGKLDPTKSANILDGAKHTLKQCFEALEAIRSAKTELKRLAQFDRWHSDSSIALIDYYNAALKGLTKTRLTYGQAQKWLNMTVKYCWVCGGADLNWLEPWYSAAHIAVDEVTLVAAVSEKVTARPCPVWSKWNNEAQYQAFQNAIRKEATVRKISPLELEFEWWSKYRSQVIGTS